MQDNLINTVTFKGNFMQLMGRNLMLNKPAPDFIAVNKEMKELGLSHFENKIKVITTLVSLDTPVCESQAREFNKSAAGFASDVAVILISKDLPFAQEKFCVSHGIDNLMVLSDYKYSSFGINYGLLIKELNLLARAIIILDGNNVVRYIQICKEITDAPDYKDALENLDKISKNQLQLENKNLSLKCTACEIGTPPLPIETIRDRMTSLADWQLVDDKKIVKEIKFVDFPAAKYFLDLLAIIAQEQGHHPTFTLIYNKLKITLTTHSSGGLTENDFIMAKIIDEL